jgi:hypothetical protein
MSMAALPRWRWRCGTGRFFKIHRDSGSFSAAMDISALDRTKTVQTYPKKTQWVFALCPKL